MSDECTFLCGLNGVISFSFGLVLSVSLDLSEVGPFVVGGEVDCYFLIVAGHLLLVLLHASFDDDVHVLVSLPLSLIHI